MDLIKLASDSPAVLLEGAKTIRKLASDNVELQADKMAALHQLHIHKLAMLMHERGLEPALSLSEKVAHLSSVEPSKLDAIEAAVEMSAGGFKLATLRTDEETSSSHGAGPTTLSGELGSSANYDRLDALVQAIG
jgi:hypothetical protein